jgi:molybdopterin converting factor small subunit
MLDEQGHLECEIEELRLEIKDNAERIDKLCNILKQNNEKLRKLKQMNDAQRNTNEAVENKRKEHLVSDLQSKNWYVNMREFIYPQLEVVDENTVKIEGVEYKKVEKEKPQTLERIIAECMVGYNNTVIVELMERILDRVEVEFFPKLGSIEPPLYGDGWEDCIKELKTRLRE